MFARRPLLLPLSLLLSVAACKGKDPVQEICETQSSCSCSMPPYATVEDCVSSLNMQTEALKTLAQSQGLTFDQGCYDRSLSQFESLGCATDFNGTGLTCDSYCAVLHGDKPAGAACTSNGGFSDCAKNLLCDGDTCRDLCARLGAGDVCAKVEGDVTSSSGTCADGLYCDYNDTLTCTALKGSGEACETFSNNCKDPLVCGQDAKCGPAPGEGEACVFSCAGDLLCVGGTCAKAPGEGESCEMSGACATGLDCNDSQVCVTPEPLICEILTDN